MSTINLSNFVPLGDGFLNKSTGTVSTDIAPVFEGLTDVITVVTGVDEQKIELNLISENSKRVEPVSGFLVEVYLSGTDGKLTRLFKEDNIDINGNIIDEGFLKYFFLELDK